MTSMVEVVEDQQLYELSCDDDGNIITKQTSLDKEGKPSHVCITYLKGPHNSLCAAYIDTVS